MDHLLAIARIGSQFVSRLWNTRGDIWPAPASTETRLPLELVYQIFDAVSDASDVQTLLSCSLLSRSTHRHARALLFRNISISTREAYFALEDSLARSGSSLESLISSLSITLNFDSPYGLTEAHLTRLVTTCPNLQAVTISILGCEPVFSPVSQAFAIKDRPAPSLSEKTLRQLSQATGITSLQVANWSDNAEILLQLLRVWPQVKCLSVSGTVPCISNPVTEPLVFNDLESLSITAQTPPHVIVLQRLLFDALGTSLRQLYLGKETDSELLGRLTPSTLSSVQVLSLPSFSNSTRDVMTKCASLRKLKIENPIAIEDFSGFPGTIESLALRVESIHHIRSLARLLPYLRCLRELYVRPRTSVNCQELFNLCRSQGIEFKLCSTDTQFEDF